MNTQTKPDELEGGIREVLAAADLREANEKAAAIPPVQRANPVPPMTKAAEVARPASVTPADISRKTMENSMSELDQINKAIADKQALVRKLAQDIEQGYRDLHHHMTELGQMQAHATILSLQSTAHSLGAELAKGKH